MTKRGVVDFYSERRNFSLLTINGILFYIREALFEPSVLVPAFISHLTSSPSLIGLGSAIKYSGWHLPQLVAARRSEALPIKKNIALWGRAVQALGTIAIIPIVLVYAQSKPIVVLTVFLILSGISSIGEGVAGVNIQEIVGKCVQVTRRGRLMIYMQTVGGFAALSAGGMVAWVLSRPWLEFPSNYSLLLFLSVLTVGFSIVAIYYINEPFEVVSTPLSLRSFMIRIPLLVEQNKDLKRYLIVRILAGCHVMAVPFYLVYAQNVMDGSGALIGAFVGVQMLGTIFGSVILGYISDNYGNKLVVCFAVLAAFTAPSIALSIHLFRGTDSYHLLFFLTYFFLGITHSGMRIGFENYLLEVVEPGIRPTCIGLSNTLVVPVCFMPLLGGYIVAFLGYFWLFISTAFLMLCALLLSIGLSEPRSEKSHLSH